MQRVKQTLQALCLMLLVAVSQAPPVYAAQSSSANYQVNEVFFGTGGELNACSTSYCSKQSAGEMTVGKAGSTNFGIQAGFNTTDRPYLEFSVTGGAVDLGVFDTATTAYTTGTMSVRSYLSSGYVLTAVGALPTNEKGDTLTGLATPTASSAGTQQFGINLVRNTNFCGAGCDLGADPVQVPSSSYSFGQVSAGYNTAGLFKYVRGDTIAYSNSSSGQTNYTVSFIYNISAATPSGLYVTAQTFVATSTY